MHAKIGWYRALYEQSINGIIIKEGYEVYVPSVTINENRKYSYVKIRVNKEQEYMMNIDTFNERFKRCNDQ